MSKSRTRVSARDPQPVSRDPERAVSPPDERRPVPAVAVTPPRCPHCGSVGPWRQGGTTRPNPLSEQMVRWRQCLACGKSHNQVWPMTEREKAKYCCPEKSSTGRTAVVETR